MALQLIGGSVTVSFEASPWGILEGGVDLGSPSVDFLEGGNPRSQPGSAHITHKLSNRTIQLRLRLSGATVDALQTEVRKVDKILSQAAIQQSARLGYPQTFAPSLDCYLDYSPSNLSAGGYFRIVRGDLDIDTSHYSGFYWRNKYLLVTLTLECWPHLIASAWVQGTNAAADQSTFPFSLAHDATGGNSGTDEAPIRLSIKNPAATQYSTVYGCIYPSLGQPIKGQANDQAALVNTIGAEVDATLYGGDYYRTNIDTTAYEQVGSLAITTDPRPKRYLLILKRRTSAVANLNWRITTNAGAVISPVWADDSTPNNTWGVKVLGEFTYPHSEYTGTTDASGVPNNFNVTLQLQAAKQAAGDTTTNVDTDFLIFIPMDIGTYFVATPVAGTWISGGHDHLHLYNDDGILRLDMAAGAGGKGGPGELVDSISPTAVGFSGSLPKLYPGANRIGAWGIRSDGTMVHTDEFTFVWTIRRRYINL